MVGVVVEEGGALRAYYGIEYRAGGRRAYT
jgi:hypothetical protein